MSKKVWLKLSLGIGIFLGISIVLLWLFIALKPKPFIRAGVKKNIPFTVLVPSDESLITLDKTSVKYDSTTKLLTYSGLINTNGAKLIFSQQPTPESFVDIPQAYEKLITSINQYSAFDSVQGKVYLTKPTELKGGTSAVMNTKGVLMFIKPTKDITEDEWKKLFNSLKIVE